MKVLIERESEPIQATTISASTTGQQPVSTLGWTLALGGGALLWALILGIAIH